MAITRRRDSGGRRARTAGARSPCRSSTKRAPPPRTTPLAQRARYVVLPARSETPRAERRREPDGETPLGGEERAERSEPPVDLSRRERGHPEPPGQPEGAVPGRQPERLQAEPGFRGDPRGDTDPVDRGRALPAGIVSHGAGPNEPSPSFARQLEGRDRRSPRPHVDLHRRPGKTATQDVDQFHRPHGHPDRWSLGRRLDEGGRRRWGRGEQPGELHEPLPTPGRGAATTHGDRVAGGHGRPPAAARSTRASISARRRGSRFPRANCRSTSVATRWGTARSYSQRRTSQRRRPSGY